jgi:iron complex outermembrane receptor protein
VRYEHHLRPGLALFAGLSRSVRPADSSERFLASNSTDPGSRWVGNPGLEPERHHQLDLGVSSLGQARQVSAVVFLDEVDDLIVRDRARGQVGILRSDLATIYRNVEARLFGVELDVWQRLTDHLSLLGNASWIEGDNTTDARPLYQIPPLQGRLRADFERGRWTASAAMRYAFDQTRVDDDPTTGSGLDAGETPGYAVYDLLGTFSLEQGLRFEAGVENVFDRQYASHLNRSSPFTPDQVRVNEPGRTFWFRVRFHAGG